MHPLRVLLYVSLAIAAAVAWGLAHAVAEAGSATPAAAAVIGVVAFLAFLLPWGGVFFWAVRRASDLDELTRRTRAALEPHESEGAVATRTYHGELDELGRGIEELRSLLVRQRLLNAEHRAAMDQIVDSLGEGLIALSPKGRIVFANQRVAAMFGEKGDLVGRPILEVARKQAMSKAFDRALLGESSVERISIGAEPVEREVEIRVFPVAASAEIAAVALFIDVTTIERLQRMRKDFLDDFSHEVRTPLAGARSAAETLQHGGLRREDENQLRHVILRQVGRIERLVTDLSDLNQIESGHIQLKRQQVSLRSMLDDLCDEVRERLTGSGVRLTLSGEDAAVDADPARVQQIFSNLIDNAWKHGGSRGEILIEIAKDGAEAVVRISDEGEGIPPAELERIFHRFYRVDRSRSQNVPGSGLGLAIAKHLTILHGGAIRAYNRPGGGATLEVRFPAAPGGNLSEPEGVCVARDDARD